MALHFSFTSQLFVLILLGVVRGLEAWGKVPSAWPAIVDFVSIFAALYLVGGYAGFAIKNLRRLPLLLSAWGSTNESRKAVSLVREACLWMAVVFLGLRMSRWGQGWEAGWYMKGVAHYDNYLDAAIALLCVSWLLSFKTVQLKLRSINLTSGRRLLFSYLFVSVVATVLLMFPQALQPGKSLEVIDALFVVISALSVTGLVTVNVAETFSLYGQSLILFLIQIGGLGIVILAAALAAATLRRLSLSQSLVTKELYDIPDIGGMGFFLTKVVSITVVIEVLGALALFFSLPPDFPNRFFHAVFQSVSAFCNAGFSSLPNNLENSPFSLWGIVVMCAMIVVGGLGFPVLLDLIRHLKPVKHFRKFQANTVLTLWTTGTLLVLGAAGIFLMETFSADHSEGGWQEHLGQSLFYSVSSRTAGFNQLPVENLSMTSLLFIMFLMVIGGGPLSTAGGLKTTSIGVIFAAAWSNLRGLRWTQFRNRLVPQKTIVRVLTGVVLYISLAVTAILVLTLTEDIDPWTIMFEVISAMSTVGLSLGATAELSAFGKLVVIFLMLSGRVGLVTFMYAGLATGRDTQRYRVPYDKFFVG